MGKKSLTKGKNGERELAAELRRLFGVDARRGQQYSGSPNSPDVVVDLPIHCEVKRCERLPLYPAVKQAVKDAGEGKLPIVFHRQNREEWLAVVRLNDLPELMELFSGMERDDDE
jgi:Holliday junction resolvase